MSDATGASVYLDANPIIYAVEGDADAAEPAKALLSALREKRGLGVTSELTLAEVLAPPSRQDALPLSVKRRLYLDILVWSGFVELKPVSRDVLYETANLRTVARLRLPDAIHLVTAIQSNCRYFVSRDGGIRQMPAGMLLVRPDGPGIANLLRAIAP
jgi:predicted nucleic acid-binding protein